MTAMIQSVSWYIDDVKVAYGEEHEDGFTEICDVAAIIHVRPMITLREAIAMKGTAPISVECLTSDYETFCITLMLDGGDAIEITPERVTDGIIRMIESGEIEPTGGEWRDWEPDPDQYRE